MNKALIYLAAAPLVLAPAGVGTAFAQEDVTTESSSLDVAGLLGVSETEASTEGEGSASAGTVTLGGEPLIEGATGGSQEGEGETSGALLDTGDTQLGSLSVGEYDARVVEAEEGTASESAATLLSATVGDEDTITVDVLASESKADSNGGSSSTDGVVIDVGGGELEVVLLHSESSTDGSGEAFLASINGEQIVSTSQADGCVVDADPLAEVICFTAEEGETTVETEAAVLDVQVIEDTLFVTVGETSAGATDEEPVPEQEGTSAESAVLQLQELLTVSGTEAQEGQATAEVLAIGGTTVVGGTQEGDGTESGAVLDTGETELGSVAVAPYEATVDGDSSAAESSVLEATLIDDETLTVEVLHSESKAGPDGSEASTQGVVIDLGGGELEVVVLESTASGDGEGSASALVVNGEPVVSSEQADGCVLDADPLLQVACVTATEGRTTIETEAAVAEAELVEDQLVLTLVGAEAQTDSSAPAQSEAAAQGDAEGADDGSGGNGGAGNGGGGSNDLTQARALPLTGSELTLLGLVGAAALAAGAGLLVASGRRSDESTA